ncbi:MAG TPA: hypothetical protein VNE86_06940 [Nitrososphaerales archaeon]|nr:hypothetical protein [Nitrososphaerales archaeon]
MSSITAAARKKAKLINDAAGIVSSRVPPPKVSETTKLVREIIKERSDPGKKMLKLGTALLIMPEPITGVAAIPMLLIGKMLSSNRGANVSGIYEELRKSLKVISLDAFP